MPGRRLAPAVFGVLELMANRPEQLYEVIVVEAVEHSSPVTARRDHPQVAQDAQLLRDGVGRESGARGEVLHGELTIDKRVEQLEAARRGEGRHPFSESFGLAIDEGPSRGEMLVGTRHL